MISGWGRSAFLHGMLGCFLKCADDGVAWSPAEWRRSRKRSARHEQNILQQTFWHFCITLVLLRGPRSSWKKVADVPATVRRDKCRLLNLLLTYTATHRCNVQYSLWHELKEQELTCRCSEEAWRQRMTWVDAQKTLFVSQGQLCNMFSQTKTTHSQEVGRMWQVTSNGVQTLGTSVRKVRFDTN